MPPSEKKPVTPTNQVLPYDGTKTFHLPSPDYTRPLFDVPPEAKERMFSRLSFIYGEEAAKEYFPELLRICRVYYAHKPSAAIEKDKRLTPSERFSQEDVILITYGDLLHGPEHSPLTTLARFCRQYLKGVINTLHILPFFPYSSDRGFSIIDYETVDPHLGSWHDIEALEESYQLMFDGVFNHISSKSKWFQEFLNDNPYYGKFFLSFASHDELTEEQRRLVFRPRTSDFLTRFDTYHGPAWVWTTFSSDQIDLNYHHPEVLLRIIEILLLYVRHGADIIRLDAATYLWEEPGTTCAHLAQTHEIIKLLKDVLDTVAPGVALITETNVPHQENISYFGNGSDEAQMVYNFALPPLVLHSFYRESAEAISEWAAGLETPSDTTTFFNFLDSHDGIGLLPVKHVLEPEEIDYIVERARENGGLVSYKTTPEGGQEAYELNITWYSAINGPDIEESLELQVRRFVASRAAALVIPGVPGIYLHGLLGTRNDAEAVIRTHTKRAINRTVIDSAALERALADPSSKASQIERELGRLIHIRTRRRAFHPNGPQKVLRLAKEVLAVLRTSPEGDQHVLTLTNVSGREIEVEALLSDIGLGDEAWRDLVAKSEHRVEEGRLKLVLEPYQTAWLQPLEEISEETAG